MRSAAAAKTGLAFDPIQGAESLRAFLGSHPDIRLWENGRVLAFLNQEDSGYSMQSEGGRLICHFWSPRANVVRRIVAVGEPAGERLRLQCLRMGQSHATALTLDGNESAGGMERARAEIRQMAMAAAAREWPHWKIEGGGSARGGWQRFHSTHQRQVIAYLTTGADEGAGTLSEVLTQALLWADDLARRLPESLLCGVRLILPEAAHELVCGRLRWLRPRAKIECFSLDAAAGQLTPVALSDCGNLVSQMRRAPNSFAEWPAGAEDLLAEMEAICPATRLEWSPAGEVVFRMRGLEIARQTTGAEALAAPFNFGYGRERTPLLNSSRAGLRTLLSSLAGQRHAAGKRGQPLFDLAPERWLEQIIRDRPEALQAECDPRFIYTQVPLCLAGHRDILDLLGVDRQGRLMVIELKASEDAGFPLQALDYWARVRHHLELGDFERLGYFAGVRLSPLPPRLLLVAPALRWHPATEAILSWLSPEIRVERLGINESWRNGLEVVERWNGIRHDPMEPL